MESILIIPREMRRKGSHFIRTQPRIRKNWSITWRQAVLLVLQHLNGSAAVVVFISWGYQASLSAFSATDAHGSYCSKSIESLTRDLRDPLISLCASGFVSLLAPILCLLMAHHFYLLSLGFSASGPLTNRSEVHTAHEGGCEWLVSPRCRVAF